MFVVLMILSLAACGEKAGDTTPSTSEVVSTLAASNLSCTGGGAIDDLQVSSVISSNYPLERAECIGTVESSNLGNDVDVRCTADAFYFDEDVYSVDASVLNEYIMDC